MKTTWLAACTAAAMGFAAPSADAGYKQVWLDFLGRYSTGQFDEGAAEIPAYDPVTRRAFVVNAGNANVDVLDLTDPTAPLKLGTIDIDDLGGSVNSVAIKNGVVALAIEAHTKTDNGVVAFYRADVNLALAEPLSVVTVGALPDMITFTPNGRKVLVACEGEPNDGYDIDPLGAISIIDITNLESPVPTTLGFSSFNDDEEALKAAGVRIYGPGATVGQDMEPEYIAVDPDGRTAYVTLQENNAIAVVEINRKVIRDILPLGYKDHTAAANGLDASDRDDAINIAHWPVFGMYQPDSIASYRVHGQTYLVTANEGDSRDYDGYSEEERVKDLVLDSDAFPDAETLQDDETIGRLNVTSALGDLDDDGDFDALYTLGGRSLSIWDTQGNLVWDSGRQIEELVARFEPDNFNASNDSNSFDNRSDNKGPEPEGLAIGKLGPQTVVFVGLERQSAILVFDISNPRAAEFLSYISTRNFAADPEDDAALAGDLGPEGLVFVPAEDSPIGEPMLIVGNEISGTTALFRVNYNPKPPVRD